MLTVMVGGRDLGYGRGALGTMRTVKSDVSQMFAFKEAREDTSPDLRRQAVDLAP